jgi:hypothetical protein
MMDPTEFSMIDLLIKLSWIGMGLGVLSGAVLGLFFHREDWMGGYNSYRRRLSRLGHISFFGLGFLNLGFALTCRVLELESPLLPIAALAFALGAVTMPLCCFLSAWKKPFRHFFPVPVLGVSTGIILTIMVLLEL